MIALIATIIEGFRLLPMQQRTDDTTLSYEKALKKTRRESIETTTRKRWLFSAGAVARQNEGRLPRRVMFGKMTGGEDRRSGGQSMIWHRGLLDV